MDWVLSAGEMRGKDGGLKVQKVWEMRVHRAPIYETQPQRGHSLQAGAGWEAPPAKLTQACEHKAGNKERQAGEGALCAGPF